MLQKTSSTGRRFTDSLVMRLSLLWGARRAVGGSVGVLTSFEVLTCVYEGVRELVGCLSPGTSLAFGGIFNRRPRLIGDLLGTLLPFGDRRRRVASIACLAPRVIPRAPAQGCDVISIEYRSTRKHRFVIRVRVI